MWNIIDFFDVLIDLCTLILIENLVKIKEAWKDGASQGFFYRLVILRVLVNDF